MTITVLTKVKVYESLIHCELCGGNQWWMKNDFPACVKCYPLPLGMEGVTISQSLTRWPRWQFIKKKMPKFIPSTDIERRQLITFGLSFLSASFCYEKKLANALIRECRDDFAIMGLARTIKKWKYFASFREE